MKRNYKINERDFRPFAYGSWHRDPMTVDEKSLTVMLRIEQTMRRLEAMGDDEQRSLWIEVKMPKRKHETNEPTPTGLTRNEWYRIISAQYRDFHYLYISNLQWHITVLQSADNAYSNKRSYPYDVKEPLLALEKVINRIVESVVANPQDYNDYVAQNLPYRYRYGRIRRDTLYALFPDNRLPQREQYMILLNDLKQREPTVFLRMTLNTYMHIWRLAYDAYCKHNERLFEHKDDSSNQTDEEMFMHHSSKGSEIKGLDYDSEQDFLDWERANSSYHNLDVAYARIHLWPHKRDDGQWELHLSFSVYGFYDDVLSIVQSLYNQGIRVVVSEHDELMGILREDDYVGIVPNPDKYMNRDGVTNQVMLPYLGEVDDTILHSLINQTAWKPTAIVRAK